MCEEDDDDEDVVWELDDAVLVAAAPAVSP